MTRTYRISCCILLVLMFIPTCLFAGMEITYAEYVQSLDWSKKNFGGVGNYWGAKLMSFTVCNDSSGNNSLKLFVATDTGNTGEASFWFGPTGNEKKYRGYGEYCLFSDNATVKVFGFQTESGIAKEIKMKNVETKTFEVWFIAKRFEWNVPDPPPFDVNTTFVLGSVPRITAAESNGNIYNPNNIGLTIPALEFPGMTDTRVPVIGGGGTASGNVPGEVIIGPGTSTPEPAVWDYGIDTTDKHIAISDLKSNRPLEIGNVTAKRTSGSFSENGSVEVRFTPENFKFSDASKKRVCFTYTLRFGTTEINYSTPTVTWENLSTNQLNAMPMTIQFSSMLNGYHSLGDLPAGNYTSTIRIEFITGE